MTQSTENFWLVWNPRGGAPSRKHSSRSLADLEAQRLAKANPGQRFFVTKSVSGFTCEVPKITAIKLQKRVDDGILF